SDSRVVMRLEQIIGRLSRQFGIGQSQIKMRLNDLRKQSRRWANPIGSSPSNTEASNPSSSMEPAEDSLQQPIEYRYDQLSAVELELLEILAINTDLVTVAIELIAPRNLVSSTALAIFQLYLNLELEGHALDFQSILTATEDPSLKNTLVSLEQQAVLKATKASMDPRARLETLCERWGASDDSDSVRSQRNALEDRSLDDQTQIDLLQSLIRQAQMKHGIEQP
ncbi:MAG: hypothetical protein ACKOOI_11635, partial [Pirellula sp.]